MRHDELRPGLYVKFTPSLYDPGPRMPLHAYTTKYGEIRLVEPDNFGFKCLVRLDEPLYTSRGRGPTGAWVRAEILEEASILEKFIRMATDETTQI
jgi:hypothetical protein